MVEKLNDMIKDRYGKGFSVRQLAGVSSEPMTDISLRGNDLYIPISVKDVFLGYGLVHEARDLSSDQHTHLSRLVRMILEPALYSQHIERTLHNLEIAKNENTHNDFGTQDIEESAGPKSIFIFGQHASRVQKIGMEIHEISQNWSYLPFKDIEARMLQVSDFEALENTTLVVDLEKSVDKAQQSLIIDYIEKGKKGAMLMFVSSKPSYQLLEAELIVAQLHELLQKCEFSVDRLPVEKETLKEVLEMIYFQ